LTDDPDIRCMTGVNLCTFMTWDAHPSFMGWK
jgi:hypothetical protein